MDKVKSTDSDQQVLRSVIDNCERLQKKTIMNLNKLEVQRESQQYINQHIDTSIEMIKELDQVENRMFNKIFEYKKMSLKEEEQQQVEIVLEHRGFFNDPNSLISKLSKFKSKKAKERLKKGKSLHK